MTFMTNILHTGSLSVVFALAVFLLAYILIIAELVDRAIVALIGAGLMIIFHILNQEQALSHIDFNTIGLLIGMMIMVNILKRTGVFQYVAIKAARLAKGDPWKIILFFSIITGVASAFLNNVTTLLLIAPVTFVITDTLKISPIPFLIPEIMASNIAGTATKIGDPPNIMVASKAGISFMDFLYQMGPVIIVIFAVTMVLFKIIYRKSLNVKEEDKQKILAFDESLAITNKSLLIKSIIVLILTIVGFVIGDKLGIEAATIAIFGASVLLLIGKVDIEELLLEVEWPTLFFFLGLFVIVGGLVQVGIINDLANSMIKVTHGNTLITAMIILWVSAIASAFLDNIPFVAIMIPLIQTLGTSAEIVPFWWALILGACLGGNGSLIGASPNVIGVAMLNKHGNKFSFVDFFKIGFPLMIVSIIISTVYIIIRYHSYF